MRRGGSRGKGKSGYNVLSELTIKYSEGEQSGLQLEHWPQIQKAASPGVDDSGIFHMGVIAAALGFIK